MMKYLISILFFMVFLLNSCAINTNSVRDDVNKAIDSVSATDSKGKADGKENVLEEVKKSIGSLFSKDKGKASKGKKVSKDDVVKYVKGHQHIILWFLLLIILIVAIIVSWRKFLKKNGVVKKR